MAKVSYAGYRTGFPFVVREKGPSNVAIAEWDRVTFDSLGRPTNDADDPHGHRAVCGRGTDWPIGFTFHQFVRFFWRIKTWELSAAFNADRSSVYPQYDFNVDTGGASDPFPKLVKLTNSATPYEVPNEAALVTQRTDLTNTAVIMDEWFPDLTTPLTWWSPIGDYSAIPYEGADPITGYLLGHFTIQAWFADTLKFDGKWWPKLFFNFNSVTDKIVTPAGIGWSIEIGSPWWQSVASVTVQIAGAEAQFGMGDGAAGGVSPSDDGTASGTITLDAAEEWPYT